MLWEGASSSFVMYLLWASSCGDCLGITGCSILGGVTALGGGTTLGGVNVSNITGFETDKGLGGWRIRQGLDYLSGAGNPNPFFVVTQPALCGSVSVAKLVVS